MADEDPNNVLLQVLATCCWGLQKTIEICDHSGLVLDPSDATEGCEALTAHIRAYAWLSLYCCDRNLLHFKVRPKSHYVCHMADCMEKQRINFNAFHTFDEESFLGKIKAICQKTHGASMTRRVFQRYCLRLALFLHQQRRQAKG